MVARLARPFARIPHGGRPPLSFTNENGQGLGAGKAARARGRGENIVLDHDHIGWMRRHRRGADWWRGASPYV